MQGHACQYQTANVLCLFPLDKTARMICVVMYLPFMTNIFMVLILKLIIYLFLQIYPYCK